MEPPLIVMPPCAVMSGLEIEFPKWAAEKWKCVASNDPSEHPMILIDSIGRPPDFRGNVVTYG